MTTDVRTAYEAAGAGWGEGPARVYARLAQPLLDALGELAAGKVLDVGSGAGLVACAIAQRGGRVVATDVAHSMLRSGREHRPPCVVADVRSLPFGEARFDLVTAAFVLNHLADPQAGLQELHRVTSAGGALLATTFDGIPRHPAKEVVDRVAARFGFVPPDWYDGLQRDSRQASSPAALRAAAGAAGWRQPSVDWVEVRADDLTPLDLAGWRLGMAHLAGFVTSLPAGPRGELLSAAAEELRGVEPLVLPVLLLRASRAGRPA